MIEYEIGLKNPQFRFLSDKFEALAWPASVDMMNKRLASETNLSSTGLIRSLYGILGFERIRGGNGFYFHNFFIPKENEKAVLEALHHGEFSKSFPEENLKVLETVYRRNRDLRELGINHRYPLFYLSEISARSQIPKEEAKKSLHNLIGVLGFCLEVDTPIVASRWFVPRSREELIKKLLF